MSRRTRPWLLLADYGRRPLVVIAAMAAAWIGAAGVSWADEPPSGEASRTRTAPAEPRVVANSPVGAGSQNDADTSARGSIRASDVVPPGDADDIGATVDSNPGAWEEAAGYSPGDYPSQSDAELSGRPVDGVREVVGEDPGAAGAGMGAGINEGTDEAMDEAAGETFLPHRGESGMLTRPAAGRSATRISRGAGVGDAADEGIPWYRSGLGATVIVLCLIGVTYFGMKKYLPGQRAAELDCLRVVARTALTPRHQLALVRLGGRFVLVGVGPEGVSLLTNVEGKEEVADLAFRAGVSVEGPDRFGGMLQEESDSFTGDERHEGVRASGGAGSLSDLLKRLRSLQSE